MTNERTRAELRDAAARSRLAYNAEREKMLLRKAAADLEREETERVAEMKLAEPPRVDDRLKLTGWCREALARIEELVADDDDAEERRLVAAAVNATTALGNFFARRQRAHRERT